MNLKRGLDSMFKQIPGASFSVQYWDGETIAYGEEKPEFLLRLRDPSSVRRLLRDPFPLARVIATCALAREESRGAHQRREFPRRDDALDHMHAVVVRGTDLLVEPA